VFLREKDKKSLFKEVTNNVYYDPAILAEDIIENKIIESQSNKLCEYINKNGDNTIDKIIEN